MIDRSMQIIAISYNDYLWRVGRNTEYIHRVYNKSVLIESIEISGKDYVIIYLNNQAHIHIPLKQSAIYYKGKEDVR